jgi:CHASE2 domain-containing sensor protein
MKLLGKIGYCFRWAARVVGGLTVLMFLAFVVGEGVPTLSDISTDEIVMFIGLAVALLGLLVSWRWTPAGCLITVAGYAVFSIGGKKFDPANPFSLFLIVVALYAIAWVFDRFSAKRMETA